MFIFLYWAYRSRHQDKNGSGRAKLRKAPPRMIYPEKRLARANAFEMKAENSTRLPQSSYRLRLLFSESEDAPPPFSAPENRIYRGVVQHEPLPEPTKAVSHPGMVTDRTKLESYRRRKFRLGVRMLLKPPAPEDEVPQAFPVDRLLRARSLRRRAHSRSLNRIYKRDAAKADGHIHGSTPQKASPAWFQQNGEWESNFGPDLTSESEAEVQRNDSAFLQVEDGDIRFTLSRLSYTSEPIVEDAQMGLRTSALAAVIVDVDQGPAGEARAKCTSRVFPLAGKSHNTGKKANGGVEYVFSSSGPSRPKGGSEYGVSKDNNTHSSGSGQDEVSAATSTGEAHSPRCQNGSLSLIAEESAGPSASTAPQDPAVSLSSSPEPSSRCWYPQYSGYLDPRRAGNGGLIVTNPDSEAATSFQGAEDIQNC